MRYLQNCPLCGGYYFQIQIFCSKCWKQVRRRTPVLPYRRELLRPPILMRYLYRWHGEDFLLEKLHLALKTPPLQMASLLFPFLSEQAPLKKVFLPVPQSSLSLQMAEAFQKFLGGEVRTILEWSYKKAPHKELSKQDRLKSRMVLKTSETLEPKGKTFILVDDVVTTGATALAAYTALSKPRAFQIWSLSCRDLN